MATTEAILCGIEGVCTLEELANELDMRKPMLMARIEFMARAGYLCEVSLGKCKGFGGCTMDKTCGAPASESVKVGMRMWILT